tara:strand:+ start:1726 stop:6309 length:4584 start_codon:yes stop_codon:yes gene_type:complete
MAIGLVSNLSWGQSYSNNKEKFIKEFQKVLIEYGRGESRNFAKNELPALLLESNNFSSEYFSRMVETCNKMEVKKIKPYPGIYNYVYSVSGFVKNKQSDESFKSWHNSVDNLLSLRNVKKYTEFIEMSAGFFEESRIATSSNFEWFYIGGEYEFIYDKKAYINFTNGNLVCRVESKKSKNKGEIIDSVNLIKTDGVFDPIIKKWIGKKGTITWEKVGLDKSTNFATINNYELSMKSSTLRIDSVLLTSPNFTKQIAGSLVERAFNINREADKVYPQFLSFSRNLLIEDIVKNVDYVGGYALQGSRFLGIGTIEKPARITYKRNGGVFMRASSKEIIITEDHIRIEKALFALYLASGDSISHVGINFTYNFKKKSVELARSGTGIVKAPFQDSYHQLEIYVPKIIWKEDSDNLLFTFEFGTSQEQKVATFESYNYFNEEVFDRLQAMETVHPLSAISKYCYKYDEYYITEGKAASALGRTVSQAKGTLIKLSNMGFISYDSDLKMVQVNKKLQTFVDAKAGQQDYDNIVFKSDFRTKSLKGYTQEQINDDDYLLSLQNLYKEKNNKHRVMKNFGVMSLVTFDLDLESVDQVLISKAKNTSIFPSNGVVKVKKNRDFIFNGWVNAGKLEINTIAANFDYENYKINLLSTGESLFRVRPMRKQDSDRAIAMVSSLQGISGELIVDDPNNKSGKNIDFGMYPKLISVNSTKVLYNDKNLYRGSYDSTRFYYTVKPFEKDSLNTFDEKSLRLNGELNSAGIFPKIYEDLKIMPDYSFGFSTKSPEGGFDFYGTGAKFDNMVVLSRSGFQGAGTIEYVKSKSVSREFTFLPDSTIGIAQFENSPVDSGTEFPDVTGVDTYITYLPRQNVLKAQSTPKREMFFYNGEATLKGTAFVRPEGMRGEGLMSFVMATLISDDFEYSRFEIDADTAAFSLKNESTDLSEDALAFKTDNVSAHVSFKERNGKFKSNSGESEVHFPVNQFMCRMDMFAWLMDERSIEMQKDEEKDLAISSGVDLVGPNFYSTNPKQDSLQFRAPKAKFDLEEKTIFCDEVEFLDIADARIFPDSMKINIRKKGKIDKLFNAKIVANYITKYHKFEQAEVSIKARRDYEAIGVYPYYDMDSNVTYISMNNIELDTTYQTTASGKIDAERSFKLSDQFDYYGDVAIAAANPLISFSGATRINHDCGKFDRNWMAFDSEINPKNIQIPVSNQMKDLEGNAISAGIVWHDSPSKDSIKMYPTFLSSLVSGNDPIVMTANGFLQYNYDASQFEISTRDKLVNMNEKGNYLALHTESCSLNGMGVIDLGMSFGDVIVENVGTINYNQRTGETSMNLTSRFDMEMDKGIFQGVAKRINDLDSLKPMDFNSNTLEMAIVEWETQKAADKLKDEFVRLGELKKVPKSLEKSITISGLRLSSFSRDQSRGLVTNADAAVLVSMYTVPVMKYVPFKAFFEQIYSGKGGDKFSMYINLPGGHDYFMHYSMAKKNGTLKIKTGDVEMETELTEMKEDKRKKKNFKFESTNNTAYLGRFLGLFYK